MPSLIYIFTGEGKGKTSAALGMVLRARCAGLKVAWIAWYKEPSWDISEFKMRELLGVELFIGGKGFYFPDKSGVKKTRVGVVIDKTTKLEHQKSAEMTLKKVGELLESQSYDLIVLDEVCQAAGEKLIAPSVLEQLIASRGKTHLVLTGRNCPEQLISLADTVTEMKKIKHVYDQGIPALKGLDF